MNNPQRARFDTIGRVIAFNTKHATELATIPEYADEVTALNNAYTIIKAAVQTQETPIGTSGDDVEHAKEKMAVVTTKYALRASIKAKKANNFDLYNKLNQSYSYIFFAPKSVAMERADALKKLMNDNIALFPNILPANIVEITNAIKAYETVKEVPVTEIEYRSANGTDLLPKAFEDAFDAIDNMYDYIYSYFIESKKALVEEFALAKQIISTGIRHTSIEGYVLVNGQPNEGAIVTLVGTKKTAIADINGHFSIVKMRTGTYHLEAKTTTGNVLSKIIQVVKGTSVTQDFHF